MVKALAGTLRHTVPGIDKIEGTPDLTVSQGQIGQFSCLYLLGGYLFIHKADGAGLFQQLFDHSKASAFQQTGKRLRRTSELKQLVLQNGSGT